MTSDAVLSSADSDSDNLLLATFRVGEATYGLDAGKIQEVIRVDRFTPVPHAPPYVEGLINLRGKIVTLIDLGRKLGGSAVISPDRKALIVEYNNELLGLVVDAVSDVVDVAGNTIDPVSRSETHGATLFTGICRTEGRLVTLLHAPSVLALALPAIRETRMESK